MRTDKSRTAFVCISWDGYSPFLIPPGVDILYFKGCLKTKNPLEVYNDRYDYISILDGDLHYRQLIQKEFDLLKEVLLWITKSTLQ